MNKDSLHANNTERELGEPRELASVDGQSTQSEAVPTLQDEGNSIFGNITNTLDEPSTTPQKVELKRPCFYVHLDWFMLSGKLMKPGLYWHATKLSSTEYIDIDDWICSPLFIEAITSSVDGRNFGRLLRFVDNHGKWHEWPMPMHMLNASGDSLLAELLDQGLVFDRKKRADLINYVMSSKPQRKLISVDRIGWHERSFVLPNLVIGNQDIVFQTDNFSDSDFSSRGSLEDWQTSIGTLCIGNSLLTLGISAALTGPLLNKVNRNQGAGIHVLGDSSIGKTTLIEVCASVWGGKTFARSWNATANGLEGVAATRNDTALILDEIDEASPHDIGKVAYMLANGQGRQRAGKIGKARKIQRWNLIAISTGERSLASIMNDVQKKPNSGQLVRLLNIDARRQYGIFDELHGFNSGHELADHLKILRLENYGFVGPAFISKLLQDKSDIRAKLHDLEKVFCSYANTNLEKRAATIFALFGLAGELGISYGILPWPEETALNAALDAFTRWKNFNSEGLNEDDRILQAIRDFTERFGDSRFSDTANHGHTIHNRAGWFRFTGAQENDKVYMFNKSGLLEAAGRFELKRVVSTLVNAKWLVDHDLDKLTKKTSIGGSKMNLYHVQVKETDSGD